MWEGFKPVLQVMYPYFQEYVVEFVSGVVIVFVLSSIFISFGVSKCASKRNAKLLYNSVNAFFNIKNYI